MFEVMRVIKVSCQNANSAFNLDILFIILIESAHEVKPLRMRSLQVMEN